MAPSNPILLAVDTCVLLDLVKPVDILIDCFETIAARLPSAPVIVVPTVLQELEHIFQTNINGQSVTAEAVFELLRTKKYGLQAVNCLPVGHAIVAITGDKLRAKGFLPHEEVHDSYVLAEAALANATILLTCDAHLLAIEHSALTMELTACHLGTPLIASPRQVVRKFFQR